VSANPTISPLDYFAWFIECFALFGPPKRNNARDYHVICTHPDHAGERTPSLHVTLKGDKIVLHCFGGPGTCTSNDTEKARLMAGAYMSMRDLFVHDLDEPTVVHVAKPAEDAKVSNDPRDFGRIISTNMGDVIPENVPWLWPGRVPLGMLTILAGPPGTAKSFVSLYLAGRITTGGIWPDVGKSAPEGTVILLAAEDSTKYTIRPRLDALGADATKVEKIEMVTTVDRKGKKHFSLTDDLVELEGMVQKTGAKLVIIDPLNSYLGGKQDGFKDVEVRSVLDPLKEMAERLGVAVILIMHLKKGIEDEVIYGIGGSVAFPAVARSIFFCTRDPETPGRFYFTHPKINISAEMPPLAYTISADVGVVWGTDPITLTAREILQAQRQKPGPKQTARLEAKQWMVEYLKEGPQTDGWATAAELRLKERTVRRALEDLCVRVEPIREAATGRITGYTWTLPPRPEDRKPF
jgi:putative DNA primase/helicase